jgi:hypothetical protein
VCLCPVDKITVISGAIIFCMAEVGLPNLIFEANHSAAMCGVRSGRKLTMRMLWVIYLRL